MFHDRPDIVASIAAGNLPPELQVYRVLHSPEHVVMFARETCWLGDVTHLMIRRQDGEPIRDWATLQRLKSEVGFGDRQAVEIYPPDAECVDWRNLYHVYVLPEGCRLPFGALHRHVPVSDA